ncbi:39S ribosomal protein L46, mitochondrial-like [Schistocerca serialis cubense]|uniref:39S ribosomal protein L46, mitochondrial-like n=1 Tax=Schistocerca serialis cubense TaxID=2023355 RepID=UPI00214E826D|nr:39S ribosomal protein L46, mitochondrial-like [Schistocerca serialis cubense]
MKMINSRVFSLLRVCVGTRVTCKGNIRCYSTSGKERWDLLSGVCLERDPIITADMTDIEKRFSEYLQTIEFENSMKSDHEIRHERDRKQAELLKKGDIKDVDLDQVVKQTAQDFEDACQEELNKFQSASRLTDADRKGNKKSLERCLSTTLMLLGQMKIGNGHVWAFPQGVRVEGETMRQAAERVLKESCGNNLRVQFIGNAPCGFYKYRYPTAVRNESVGAKVFFFKARYLSGDVKTNKNKLNDFQWLNNDELQSILHRDYYRSISQFLVV